MLVFSLFLNGSHILKPGAWLNSNSSDLCREELDKFWPWDSEKETFNFLLRKTLLLYNLSDGKQWPSEGSLAYNTILQWDLFGRWEGGWSEVPYVRSLQWGTTLHWGRLVDFLSTLCQLPQDLGAHHILAQLGQTLQKLISLLHTAQGSSSSCSSAEVISLSTPFIRSGKRRMGPNTG